MLTELMRKCTVCERPLPRSPYTRAGKRMLCKTCAQAERDRNPPPVEDSYDARPCTTEPENK